MRTTDWRRFNPPPALSARGTLPRQLDVGSESVSIHPPLCRRGELQRTVADVTAPACFNPPPALSARGTLAYESPVSMARFQSTPRFVGEGNGPSTSSAVSRAVSIHPPLCRRGEHWPRRAGLAGAVSIHPPLCRRGERASGPMRLPPMEVSIHPPLCRRGEREPKPRAAYSTRFQSTPRFVGEGNAKPDCDRPKRRGFNPPPALSARGTPATARG